MTNVLPVVYIFTNPNVLSQALSKELVNKCCRVIVVTPRTFSEILKEIPTYLFLIKGFSSQSKYFSASQIKSIFQISETYSPKTQVILPYMAGDDKNRKSTNLSINTARTTKNRSFQIFFLGDLY